MGKKPVATLIGLVWAGIALTGCGDCCKNCRNKNCGAPAVASRNTSTTGGAGMATPTMIGDTKPVPGATTTTPESRLDNPPMPNSLNNTSGVQPASGTTGMPTGSASGQHSLASPAAETTSLPSNPVPPRMDDGLGASPVSRTGGTPEVRRVPPVPVMPKTSIPDSTSSSMPSRPADLAPPISGQPLPPVGAASAPPAPVPAPSESLPPLPESSGSSALPPLPK
jgi:hypothetical protein